MIFRCLALNQTRLFSRLASVERGGTITGCWCWLRGGKHGAPRLHIVNLWVFCYLYVDSSVDTQSQTVTDNLRKQLALLSNVPKAQRCSSHAWRKTALSKWQSRTSGEYKSDQSLMMPGLVGLFPPHPLLKPWKWFALNCLLHCHKAILFIFFVRCSNILGQNNVVDHCSGLNENAVTGHRACRWACAATCLVMQNLCILFLF